MGMNDLLLRIRALRSRQRAERDLDDELSFHLEMEARKKRLEGVPDDQARRSARAAFGGVEQVREQCRDVRGLGWLEDLGRDLRYGVRVLRQSPAFALIAMLSLAIGIGANTAVFSLVDRVLLRNLPVRNPEELVVLKWSADPGSDSISRSYAYNDGPTTNVFSWRIFSEMRRSSQAAAAVFGFSPADRLNVTANNEARVTGGLLVSGNYFSALGVGMALGRPLVDDDDTVDGVPAAVISYRLWERAFGMDPSVIGKPLYINRAPFAIVGVAPRGFYGVSMGGFFRSPEIDVTLPVRVRERLPQDPKHPIDWFAPNFFSFQVMARLKPGAGTGAAKAEFGAILVANMPEEARKDPKAGVPRIEIESGAKGLAFLRQDYRDPLLILTAVVGLALLMTCANLAGLLLARATARKKEIALRLAMGAGRFRLVRQLLMEGILLSAGGALAGLLLAAWGIHALLSLLGPVSNGVLSDLTPDMRVLAFTAAISLLTTLLFGLAPAMRATRVDLSSAMKDDRLAAGGSRRTGPVRILLAVQIGVALGLVVSATLVTRSLANLRAIPLGFNPQKLVLFGLSPGSNGYDEARGYQLYANVLERLKRIPGVTHAGVSALTPVGGFSSNGSILVENGGRSQRRRMNYNYVGPGFLETLQVPIVLGRGIEQRDMSSGVRVAVMNETAARRAFGSASPLGGRFRYSDKDPFVEVVGVARDSQYDRIRNEPMAVTFIPYTQTEFGWLQSMNFEVRTASDTAFTTAAIRAAVHEFDRMLPLLDVKTMETQLDEALAQQRLFAALVSLFGSITLALACVGLYGAVSYSVARRTREIGVRIAMGASRMAVLRLILAQVAVTTAAGLLIGIPATRALTRLVASQLYGIQPQDPLSLAGAAVAVVAIAMVAALVPARRAMRVDPVRALRCE